MTFRRSMVLCVSLTSVVTVLGCAVQNEQRMPNVARAGSGLPSMLRAWRKRRSTPFDVDTGNNVCPAVHRTGDRHSDPYPRHDLLPWVAL
jgi:hypothetical protein